MAEGLPSPPTSSSPRTGKKAGQEQHWQVLQKRTFTRYINSKLKCRNIEVTDLYEDLKNGVVLYNFLEVLTGESLKRFGKLNNGNMRIQQVANQNVVFKFFPEADIKLENIGVMDVVDGTPTPVLGLIWSIIAFYLVKELATKKGEPDPGDVDDLAAVKKKILKWCKKHTQKRNVPVNNLTDSFANGKAFLAILNDIDNAGSPYAPLENNPCANFRRAFTDAEDKYGLPIMLDPDDPKLWEDEISMLTYLATMMDTLPDSVAQPDPNHLLDDWIDDHNNEAVDELYALCQCASTSESAPGKDAAKKRVMTMLKATFGCTDLRTSSKEDPGLQERAAGGVDDLGDFLVGSWIVNPSAPTILLYATIGVEGASDESSHRSLGSASASAATPSWCWVEEQLKATKTDDAVLAKGAKNDKTNVVASIFAVRALRDVLWTIAGARTDAETRPYPSCNVKIMVGSEPASDRVADALASIDKSKLLDVDYVVVAEGGVPASGHFAAIQSNPTNGATKAAVLHGCRGYVKATFSTSLAEQKASSSSSNAPCGPSPGVCCAGHVGPLIDPASALALKVAALRDDVSAAPSDIDTVAGLPALSLDFVEYRSGGFMGRKRNKRDTTVEDFVDDAKTAAGIFPTVKTAPEFSLTMPRDTRAALALEPGLTIDKFWTTTGGKEGASDEMSTVPPVSSRRKTEQCEHCLPRTFDRPQPSVPMKATATLRALLPPGYDDITLAKKKLEAALNTAQPNAFQLVYEKNAEQDATSATNGRSGYLSDPRQPFAQVLVDALGRANNVDSKDQIGIAASPAFAPVPAAFARVLPNAAVFQCGAVPESEDLRDEAGRERVQRASVATHTKALASFLNTAEVPKLVPKINPYHAERIESVNANATDTRTPEATMHVENSEPAVRAVNTIPQTIKNRYSQPVATAPSFDPLHLRTPPLPSIPPVGPKEAPPPNAGIEEPAKAPPTDAVPLSPPISTVKDVGGLTAVEPVTEERLLGELNALRANPVAYAAVLEDTLPL